MIRKIAFTTLFLGAATLARAASPTTAPAPLPPSHTAKVELTPQFYQQDARGKFPNGGRSYCCPTAMSDVMMYLAGQGFENLVTANPAGPVETQVDVLKLLASKQYLNASPTAGTGIPAAMRALQKYVVDRGYKVRKLEYAGWRPLGESFAPNVVGKEVDLDWMKSAVVKPNAVVLINVGWYEKTAEPGVWKRITGHWVPVVGYGTDGVTTDPNILLLDDPNQRRGAPTTSPTTEPAEPTTLPADMDPATRKIALAAVRATRLTEGTFTGPVSGTPAPAAGSWRLLGPGLRIESRYDLAVLDGAVVMEIEK